MNTKNTNIKNDQLAARTRSLASREQRKQGALIDDPPFNDEHKSTGVSGNRAKKPAELPHHEMFVCAKTYKTSRALRAASPDMEQKKEEKKTKSPLASRSTFDFGCRDVPYRGECSARIGYAPLS